MKKYIIIPLFIALLFSGCDDEKFLEETPLDFISANNAYKTKSDFELAVNELYFRTRLEFYCNGDYSIHLFYGTDLMENLSSETLLANLGTLYAPTAELPKQHWDMLYKLISGTNIIISRVPESDMSDEDKILFEAKAKFFRGLAYRTLAYLYGGVPLVLEEITTPKTDFVRASKDKVLQQAVEDAKFAAENLEDITDVLDGQISSPAAYHLLSELYLATGQDQLAVNAASAVINNPNLGLMTDRFGSRASETPGDVYWDLFRMENQNRSAYNNTEGLFVIQIEIDVPGGGGSSTTAFWTVPGNFLMERHCAPQTQLFRMIINGVNGTKSLTPFTWPISDYTGGRGIGSAVPTAHFHDSIWASDFYNDIRNANHNFVRTFYFNNADFLANYGDVLGDSIDIMNPGYGDSISFETGYTRPTEFRNRFLTGYQTKCTTPYNHPEILYLNPETYELKGGGDGVGGTFTDQYMFRLAETYLLRAEAYLNLGQKDNAAADINVVRNRANASPVDAADVDLDYILDERMRELGIEEKRRLTLARLGTDVFYDRVTRFNPYYSDPESTADGLGFLKKYTIWPIPQSAIEANKDAVLEQNPEWVE